ncbi:hypothetical protein WICANDRAFT_75875 [Wickerhamomyces anomalus NRRL Y-366-8]|uniref:Isochorismatase-like domain-containing protein n=1 Tax=Wickerhamomyces anomalus (strain ATCC 58044 / CBS 1984 / NCYC 433 / NRRL Y-366-8) TaxID=683960 RepID=A0A1E3P8D7_WICAA|nr:uncharacterized protein WICANDRAFT_75875 [Wickerhamomyces anomalus NRRL Y-366-8]ODQ61669.1 hypothetical protein WICANDRAFT_75875 [Wickerhamomyces anomalus NRRL Y-366-8]
MTTYKKALLLIDIQNDYFQDQNGKYPLVNINEAAQQSSILLNSIRKDHKDVLIIHIRHIEQDPNAPFFVKDSSGAKINDIVTPQNDEIIITKHHPNSFIETGLQNTLEEHGVKELIIVGAMTHMCVQGTARSGAELGYDVVVVKDAIATRDLDFDGKVVSAEQVTTTVLSTLSFLYGKVSSVDEVLENLG